MFTIVRIGCSQSNGIRVHDRPERAYGHFFCHVFHQDYIIAKGNDCQAIEERMWELLDQRGAEYPAEHNVGHLYKAKPALVAHYKELDPCNAFNPGIGRTTKCMHWHVHGGDN